MSPRTQVVAQEVVGIIGSMPTSRALVMSGGLLGVEPAPISRVPAIGKGLLELLLVVDKPRRRPQGEPPDPVAPMRRRFVPSMIQMTVGTQTLSSRVLRAIVNFAGLTTGTVAIAIS